MQDDWEDRRSVSPELQELREAIVKLTIVQDGHAKLLTLLTADQIENTKYKARIGGIVLSVSVFWVILIAVIQFWRR